MITARPRSSTPTVCRLFAALTLALTTIFFAASGADAQSGNAEKILKAMSDYVASQKTISLTFDSDIEVVTPDLQKIQFTNSGQLLLSRPDKLRGTRTGGYADVELVFDGKMLTVLGNNAFAQVNAPGSIDQIIVRLRNDLGVALPGADLLLSRVYEELMMDVLDAKHIGQGVINGVECEHLAFRNHDTDWQLWVQVGPRPIPCKYVITSKTVNSAPQYTLRVKDWKTDVQAGADAFVFKAPADAKKVEFSQLSDIDEVPAGTPPGGKQ
jgi:hypothetical protein